MQPSTHLDGLIRLLIATRRSSTQVLSSVAVHLVRLLVGPGSAFTFFWSQLAQPALPVTTFNHRGDLHRRLSSVCTLVGEHRSLRGQLTPLPQL